MTADMMTSSVSMTTQYLLLLPLLCSSLKYQEFFDKRNTDVILPWHRIAACPSDSDNFVRDPTAPCSQSFHSGRLVTQCDQFTQYCYDKTMSVSCDSYSRVCETGKTCSEEYVGCQVSNLTTAETFITKAKGVPQPFYPECVPALTALRDQCEIADLNTCTTNFAVDTENDYLLRCKIECGAYEMQCYNYTRTCTSETTAVTNTRLNRSIRIDKNTTDCSIVTKDRPLDKHAVWNGTIVRVETDAEGKEKEIPRGLVIIDRFEYYEYDQEESWEDCIEATQVPYQPMCNQFISHIMKPLKGVVFEPHAYDLNEGIKMFLRNWDKGFEVLCDYRCFRQLIKFSRTCWPKLPIQKFLPGADYHTLENVLKNMTRIGCFTVDPPSNKSVDEPWLNSRNSCAIFFDADHNITKPYYQMVEDNCDEGDASLICTPKCNSALDAIAQRFGCCLGSIRNEYNNSSMWYEHWNFRDNPVLRRLNTCNTTLITACETIFVTSIVVSVFRNLIYVIGGLMCLVIVLMIISFYWQLEHEPIKKRFYHF